VAGPTIEEVSYFKGISTHPDSISVGTGTFRDIRNGWILRDGIIDMRPGFALDTRTPRAPGLYLVPGTSQASFAAVKTIGTNTFVENDGRMFWFEPGGVANSGMVGISAGDTLHVNPVFSVAVNSSYIALGYNGGTTAVISVVSRTTGELVANLATSGTFATATGLAWDPVTGELWWSDATKNKVFSGTIGSGTISVTNTIGSGVAGLTTGTPLSGVQLNSPYGLCVFNSGGVRHVYIVCANYVYDANITTNTGSLVAGATANGYVDGTGAAARFNFGNGASIGFFSSNAANLYVTDVGNNVIRKVTTAGVVTTFAGSLAGTAGHADGVGTAATFSTPMGLACVTSPNGVTENTLFVIDNGTALIRNIKESNATVATMAGTPAFGSPPIDGPVSTAVLSQPGKMAFATNGASVVQLFFVDTGNSSAVRLVDLQNPVIANNGAFGTGGGTNGLVMSTFMGDLSATATASTAFAQKLGFAGGIYNYNNTVPAVTAASGTHYNGVMRFFQYSGTTYFNSVRGVMGMDLPTTYTTSQIAHYAGAPQGYDLILTLVGAPGTLLAAQRGVAYRIVWGYRTASGRPILGTPSSRFVINNPTGAPAGKNVQIVSQIPIGATTSWVYQLYRSEIIDIGAGVPADPGDTLFLVYEANVSVANLTAGTVTITDSTPDAALGEDLYTNTEQETFSQANAQPPICLDMCLFGEQSMAIYANYTNKINMFVNLIGVTGFTGSPTITFTFADGLNNFTITGDAAAASDGVFKYTTGGTDAANIDATARSIVLTINQYTLNRRLRAFYVSLFDGTPGQIAIQENFIGGQAWAITATAAISPMFAPIIPTSGTAYQSVPDSVPNGLMLSKIGNPDAVPLVNRFTVGDSSESIRRVFALRESVMIIKERSVWRGTGNTPESFSLTLLDNTVSIRADEACALLNNEVYALTTQGVVAISDNGVRIVGRPVEYQLDQIYGTLAAPLDLNGLVTSFGSEDYRTFFLSSFKTTSNFTWAYGVFTNAWTRWDLILQGITVRNGRIIGAVLCPTGANTFEGNTPQILQQLNLELFESPLAYHDIGGLSTILTINSGTKVITISYNDTNHEGRWQYPYVSVPTVGWIIGQSLIVADDGAGNLTVNDITGLNVDTPAQTLRPINFTMTSNPHNGGATFKIKQWSDFFCCLENQNLLQFTAGFKTNNQAESAAFSTQVKAVGQTNGTPQSAAYYKEQVFKATIPKACAMGNLLEWQLSVSQANALVAVKSIGIETRGIDSAKGQQ
jgi:hypothetical protein